MQDTSGDILKKFHLDSNIQSKSDKAWGEQMARYVIDNITAPSSYYYIRNQRFKVNRDTAAGKMNMRQFQDLLRMNGKQNYLNLIWDAIMIVNTIVSRLVGRWITQETKISCTAIDMKSQQQRNKMRDEAEFNITHKQEISQLEESSGVPLTDKTQYQPEDFDELDLWIQDFMRLPEEILYELGINHVFGANGWDDVLLRRVLNDAAVVGLIGSYTYMNREGEIIVEYLKSENVFYSYSEYDDFRDTSYRGFIKSMNISDIRSAYPKLPEKTLFEIAAASKQYQYPDKLRWNNDYNYTFVRPYDDWNVDVIFYFIKTTDNKNTLYKVGRDGNLYMDRMQTPPDELYGKNTYSKTEENIYKGVYVRDSNTLLEWTLQENMIRPQDPKESGNVEFPISLYMYHNRDMRNVAVPEKIEEPVKMMILTRLKIQQLIAMMSPPGRDYNVRAMRELDLGTGNLFKPLDLQRLKQQTGTGYFTDIDAEGNPIGTLFQDSPNNEGAAQLQTLIETYNYHQQVLRDELGINEVTEGQSIKPRVGAQNVQTSIQISFNATDYMRDAVISLLQDTARKVACLLNDSVTYGASRYREILKQEDVVGRDFLVKIEDLPQETEIQYLNEMLNAAMASNPQLVLYLDPFKVRRIARENVKLAELYFYNAQKKALKGQMEQAAQNMQANAEVAVQGAQAKAQGDMQLKEMEGQIDMAKTKATVEGQNTSTIISMVSSILSKGLPIDASVKPLIDATIQNLMIPRIVENEQMRMAILQQIQAAQQPPEQQQPQPEMQPGMEQEPPPQEQQMMQQQQPQMAV